MSNSDDGGEVIVRGCRFPTHLLYDVAHHMWYRPEGDGLVRLGMTAVGPALASNRIFAFTPKRVGRDLEKGRSCATIESSKWVGPARVAFDGQVVEVNETLIDRPDLMVDDPYDAGWFILARPSTPDILASLVTGPAVAAAYEAWMQANDFPGCEPVAP